MTLPLQHLGVTRASVQWDHALITPDTHVRGDLPGWEGAQAIVHISPAIGNARFTMFTAELPDGATVGSAPAHLHRFVMVTAGSLTVEAEGQTHEVGADGFGYAFLPAGTDHRLTARGDTVLAVFEKPAQPHPAGHTPRVVVGREADLAPTFLGGDEDLRARLLLPNEPGFDIHVNTMTFDPGATLSFTEVHVIEHGLLMLRGSGIYRLGERWYPVTRGDVIWMRSFTPQWYGALGKTSTKYLLYKDMGRHPLNPSGVR